jgi:hypothetical protein
VITHCHPERSEGSALSPGMHPCWDSEENAELRRFRR